VLHVDAEDVLELTAADDQQPVEALAPGERELSEGDEHPRMLPKPPLRSLERRTEVLEPLRPMHRVPIVSSSGAIRQLQTNGGVKSEQSP
jgi:hypothetical protein